jgi:hypothetical protein
MPITLSGTTGITTPAIADTGTLSVTGVTTLTGGLNAALPVLSGGTGVTTSTGTGANVLGTSPTLATPTFDSAQLPTISGTAPLYMCRAWVNFNGTGTVAIRASGNVSSITDRGVGRYTVNFTTAMVDVNYSTSTGVRKLDTNEDNNMVITLGATTTAYSTTAVALTTGFATSASNQDAELACVAVFR